MTLSFLHRGSHNHASFRYRAWRIAEALRASINDYTADLLVFAKPWPSNLEEMRIAKANGQRVIVDSCDAHWYKPEVKQMMVEADALTVNTPYMAKLVFEVFGRTSYLIHDPYEYEEVEPHCSGNHLLWYGHPNNADSFNRIARFMQQYPFAIVTNQSAIIGTPSIEVIEWSHDVMLQQFAIADIVLMPETAPYKSANRTIEAVRQGCFVVAEPHQSLMDIPGIWIGNIKEGVAWAIANPAEARQRTRQAQLYVAEKYSLAHAVNAWKTLLKAFSCILDQEENIGTAGSMSMPSEEKVSLMS